MATVVPAGIFRLKCSSTFSPPSGYRKVTSRNSISPRMGSQFSRLGWKASPYFSITAGVSTTVGTSSRRPVTRSMEACREMNSAMLEAVI